MATPTTPQLKRLGFLLTYVSGAVTFAESAYKTARTFVPGFLEGTISQVEETTTSVAAPYYNYATDLAGKALETADSTADSTLNTLDSSLNFARELHTQNMASFNAAKDGYLKWLESSVSWVKSTLNPYPYLQWAVDKVVYVADPDKFVDSVSQVTTYAPVSKLLEVGDPVIKAVEARTENAVDYVVTNPTYQKLYTQISGGLTYASKSSAYEAVVSKVWPVAEPVAGPVYDNFARSKYLAQLAEAIKPKIA